MKFKIGDLIFAEPHIAKVIGLNEDANTYDLKIVAVITKNDFHKRDLNKTVTIKGESSLKLSLFDKEQHTPPKVVKKRFVRCNECNEKIYSGDECIEDYPSYYCSDECYLNHIKSTILKDDDCGIEDEEEVKNTLELIIAEGETV